MTPGRCFSFFIFWLASVGWGNSLAAQTSDRLDENAPLSAIDWLSETVEVPEVPVLGIRPGTERPPDDEAPVAESALPPEVNSAPLGTSQPFGLGLLSSATTGLPNTLWNTPSETEIVAHIRREGIETLPALQAMLIQLMLADTSPAQSPTSDGSLFTARVDKLLDLGALEQAQALLEQARPLSPTLFRRWFDVALLTGSEEAPCQAMRENPSIAPTPPAQIFCTGRGGNWAEASEIFEAASQSGALSDADTAVLARFLDPELFEGAPPLTLPTTPSPLTFRLFEAIGERFSAANLPRAFAHADLLATASWRNQMLAAERLARTGALDPNRLRALYLARKPAASGGVWARAALFQQFDRAAEAGDIEAMTETLPEVFAAMEAVWLEVSFAELYFDVLSDVDLPEDIASLVATVLFLSPAYERAVEKIDPNDASQSLLAAIASGSAVDRLSLNDPVAIALARAFQAPLEKPQLEGLGTGILSALSDMTNALHRGQPDDFASGIQKLRALGLESLARRAALQFLLLDRSA